MALMKCLECGSEISDKAVSCPHCGCPISKSVVQIETGPEKPINIEPNLTSKKWKMVKLIAWLIILLGLSSAGLLEESFKGGWAIGILVGFVGLILLIVGKIGAWYEDKRTR